MITVNSVSGGKTSAYMATKYPADLNIFACVLTRDKECFIKDKGLLREIQKRIPHFVASRELDTTLKAVIDLEQFLGKEIKWVSSQETYESLITRKNFLPNGRHRFCTQELKVKPIIYYLYHYARFPIIMNLGFRFDESERVKKWKCTNDKFNGIEWRVTRFPLYEDKIEKKMINDFWDTQGIAFPSVSNCDFCFFHTKEQHRQQLKEFPNRLNWWTEQEELIGKTFSRKASVHCLCHD